jgi:hypothetical protein
VQYIEFQILFQIKKNYNYMFCIFVMRSLFSGIRENWPWKLKKKIRVGKVKLKLR